MAWSTDVYTDFSTGTRTEIPVSGFPALSTVTGCGGNQPSVWTDVTGSTWGTNGGMLIPGPGFTVTPGSYTVAPTIGFSTTHGNSGNYYVPTAVATLSGGGLGQPTINLAGLDLTAAPTFNLSGGTGSGGSITASSSNLTGTVLVGVQGSGGGAGSGCSNPLIRQEPINQGVMVGAYWTGQSAEQLPAIGRVQTATGVGNGIACYNCVLKFPSGTGVPTMTVSQWNGTTNTFVTASPYAIPCTGLTNVSGNFYVIHAQFTGSSPTSIVVVVTQWASLAAFEAAGTPIASYTLSTLTDSTAALQTSGGVGTGWSGGSTSTPASYAPISYMLAEAQTGFTISPSTGVLNSNLSLACAGFGSTNWSGTTASNWSVTGSTAATIVSWTPVYQFTVSGITTAPSVGDTYSNNGVTYTLTAVSISGGAGTLSATGSGAPTASGTLTRVTGSGDATIAFSAVSCKNGTLVVSTGNTAGIATLNDASSGTTAPLTLNTLVPPTLSISSTLTAAPTVSFSGPPTTGNPNYTVVLYRSTNSNLNTLVTTPVPANDPAKVVVSTQTVNGSTTPSAFADSGLTAGTTYFYISSVTDSTGQVQWSNQVGTFALPAPQATGMTCIGDSITAGVNATNYLGMVVSYEVTGPGSGYTTAPTVTLSGGGGTGATARAIVSGGAVTGVYATNNGRFYTSAPTISFSGGGGTGAAASVWNGPGGVNSGGGGWPLALWESFLLNYGVNVPILNQGYGGSTSSDWASGSTNLHGACLGALAAGTNNTYTILLGANDASDNFSVATYTTNITGIVNYIIANGSPSHILILSPFYEQRPTYNTGVNGPVMALLIQQYDAACPTIAASLQAANPSITITYVPYNTFGFFLGLQKYLLNTTDTTHPTDAGYGIIMAALQNTKLPVWLGLATGNNGNPHVIGG